MPWAGVAAVAAKHRELRHLRAAQQSGTTELRHNVATVQIRGAHGSKYAKRNVMIPEYAAEHRPCQNGWTALTEAKWRTAALLECAQADAAQPSGAAPGRIAAVAGAPLHVQPANPSRPARQNHPWRTVAVADGRRVSTACPHQCRH